MRPVQHLTPDFDGLRSGHGPAAVDDEEGHAADAEPAGILLMAGDAFVQSFVAESGPNLSRVEPEPGADLDEFSPRRRYRSPARNRP